jgi:FKBP-type peptidyl-prolyl cis-trans isomerase
MAWHHRAAAGIGALLFLITSAALTITVLWAMHQQSEQNKINSGLQEALKQQQAQQQTPQEGKLQGTQLAGFTPVAHIDTLQKIDTKPGTGDEVKAGDTVTVHYTGAVAATGVIFQSSKDTGQPVSFGLNEVIKGWTDGVPGMKTGGTRRLLIPAAQAYGANPPSGSGIPANADLVFDIELIKIGK